MEINPIRAKHQKEVLLVAQDVFHYLSTRFFPERVLKKPSDKSHYNLDIGKACSYRLKFANASFREICDKHYPPRVMGSRIFVCWFQEILFKHYAPHSTPFSSVIESLGLMFEGALCAYQKGQTNLYQILPIMWTDHFMQKLYPEFFDKGGWHSLKKKAKEVVGIYETFFLISDGNTLDLLSQFRDKLSPVDESATASSKPPKKVILPPDLQREGFPPTVDESSDLSKTLQKLLDLKVEEGNMVPIIRETPIIFPLTQSTAVERLPGNRKFDPIHTYNTSPEISPPESPHRSHRKETAEDIEREKSCVGDIPKNRRNIQGSKKKSRKCGFGRGKFCGEENH